MSETADVNIAITSDLAQTVGTIGKKHPACAIEIRWFSKLAEEEWIITATDGTNDRVYLARDDSTLNYADISDKMDFLASLDYQHPAIAEHRKP